MKTDAGWTANTERVTANGGASRRLIAARAAWVGIVLLTLVLFAASLPTSFEAWRTVCRAEPCLSNQLDVQRAQAMAASGVSMTAYGALSLARTVIFGLVFALVGAVIFWRRSDDPVAFSVSLMLVTFGMATYGGNLEPLRHAYPALIVPVGLVHYTGQITVALFFYTFPDGRFVPRWTRVSAIAWALWSLPGSFLPTLSSSAEDRFDTLYLLIFLAFIATFLAAQLYRFRRVSLVVARQQTKWVVYGVAVPLGATPVIGLSWLFLHPEGILRIALDSASAALMMLIPISIAMAILRARLWDIDIIIRRTLVYGALTAILALVYFGSVIVLQGLARALLGEGQQPLVTVLSTLAIAGLFQPLRRRVQTAIDRRFYRHKYDAARVIAAFGGAVRDEVELGPLTEHLLAVVGETMQPSHVSLWLGQAGRAGAAQPGGEHP